MPDDPRPRVSWSGPRPRARRSRRAATSCLGSTLMHQVHRRPRRCRSLVRSLRPARRKACSPSTPVIIRGLIPIRDAVRAVLRAQEANEPWGQAADTRLKTRPMAASCGSSARSTRRRITTRTDEETGEVSETIRRPNLAAVRSTIQIAGWSPRSRITTSRQRHRQNRGRSSRKGSSIRRWSRSSPRPPMRSPSPCTNSATSTSTARRRTARPVARGRCCSPSWAMPCSSIRP